VIFLAIILRNGLRGLLARAALAVEAAATIGICGRGVDFLLSGIVPHWDSSKITAESAAKT